MYTLISTSSTSAMLARLQRDLATITRDEARAAVEQLAKQPDFLHRHVRPLLPQAPAQAHEPSILATLGLPGADSARLHIFYWPAGASTPIHDHSSWGVYQCVSGELLEDRYDRLDDGAQPETAHLRKSWRRVWERWDGASTVGAYERGIHRIANPSRRAGISIHLYGPQAGLLDGRDYDPTRDFVCDRVEFDEQELAAPALMFV